MRTKINVENRPTPAEDVAVGGQSSMKYQDVLKLPVEVLRLGAEACWANVEIPGPDAPADDRAITGETLQMVLSIVGPLAALGLISWAFSLWFLLLTPWVLSIIKIFGNGIERRVNLALINRPGTKTLAYSTLPRLCFYIGVPIGKLNRDDLVSLAFAYWGTTGVRFGAAVAQYRKDKDAQEARDQAEYERLKSTGRTYDYGRRTTASSGAPRNYEGSGSGRRYYNDDRESPSINPGTGYPQITPGGLDVGGYAPGDGPSYS